MYKNKTFSPYRVVGTMLKNWHFSPVDAVADGGTAPADANPITKAAEKYAESRISNVTAYNPMAKHIRKAEKGRKWEDTIIKLVDSVAYARNVAPQAPTPPDILSMTYKTNTSRQFKTSLYEKDVDAVVRGDMEAQELNDKIVGALAESRDYQDFAGLQEMLSDLFHARIFTNGIDNTSIDDLKAAVDGVYGKDIALTASASVAELAENIVGACARMRLCVPGYTGTTKAGEGGVLAAATPTFEQRADSLTIYLGADIYAKLVTYLKGTRSMTFADLGAEVVVINNPVTHKDTSNKISDVVAIIDDRAVGLVHYSNEVRAGAFNPDAWATPFVLNEIGNFYYSAYFNSSFHALKRV